MATALTGEGLTGEGLTGEGTTGEGTTGEGTTPAGRRIAEPVRRWFRLVRTGSEHPEALPSRVSGPALTVLIIYVFLLFCVPSQLIIGPLGAPGTPANLLGVFALLWWVCARLGGLNPHRDPAPVRIALAALLVAVLLSYANAMFSGWYAPVDVHQSTDFVYSYVAASPAELGERMTSAASRGLLAIAGWSGILLLTADGLRSWADLSRLITWIVRFGVFVGSLGIVQFFTGLDIAAYFVIPGLTANADFGAVDARSVLNRVSSTGVHPIEFGVLMAVVFLLSLHRSLYSRPSVIAWLPTVITGLAMPMSISRSAIVATFLGGLIMFVAWPPARRLAAVFVLPFAVVGIRLIAPGLVGTIRSLFLNLGNDPSVDGRTGDYVIAGQIIAMHPWLGRGLFTFIPRYYRILDNQLLLVTIELGLIGLIVFLGLFVTAIMAARGAYRRARDPEAAHLGLTLSGVLVGVLVSFATFDALGFPQVAGSTFLIIGMASAAWTLACADQKAVYGVVPMTKAEVTSIRSMSGRIG